MDIDTIKTVMDIGLLLCFVGFIALFYFGSRKRPEVKEELVFVKEDKGIVVTKEFFGGSRVPSEREPDIYKLAINYADAIHYCIVDVITYEKAVLGEKVEGKVYHAFKGEDRSNPRVVFELKSLL